MINIQNIQIAKTLIVLLVCCLFSTSSYSQERKIVGNTLVYVNESDSVTRDSTATEKYDIDKYFNPNMTDEERALHKQNIQQFSDRIEENPNDVAAYVNRGAYYSYLGLYVQAIKDYDAAIEIYPNIPEVYYNRALAKARFVYTLDACMDLKKAYELGLAQAKALIDQNCRKHKEAMENQDPEDGGEENNGDNSEEGGEDNNNGNNGSSGSNNSGTGG